MTTLQQVPTIGNIKMKLLQTKDQMLTPNRLRLLASSDPTTTNSEQAFPTTKLDKMALESPEKRITIWNRLERRKISGNAAPMGKNLMAYLSKHPHCEVYDNQDKSQSVSYFPSLSGCEMEPPNSLSLIGCSDLPMALPMHQPIQNQSQIPEVTEKRVTIWHREERRKISGNAAPMEKNLNSYLVTHPLCEIYVDQDKTDSVKSQPSPSSDQLSDSHVPFEEVSLSPIESFSLLFDERNTKFLPIPSPGLPMLRTRALSGPLSPVDSLSSSLDLLEFSVGSQCHFSKRMRTHDYMFDNLDGREEADELDDSSSVSSTRDDFGVFGDLEGF